MGGADRMLWFSTTSWMMWNALVSSLLVGSSLVMVDGNPMYPDLAWQWQLAAETQATIMGASPGFIMACCKAGVRSPRLPRPRRPRRRLGRCSASPRGVRLDPRPARTAGPAQCGQRRHRRVLGPSAEQPAAARMGRGDLRPLPGRGRACLRRGRPRGDRRARRARRHLADAIDAGGVVGDEGGHRLRATYFDRWPGIWRHGDWIVSNANGSCHVAGRSDATLNRGGVRLGTAESTPWWRNSAGSPTASLSPRGPGRRQRRARCSWRWNPARGWTSSCAGP